MHKNIHTFQDPLPFPKLQHRSAGFILSGFAVGSVVVATLFWVMYQLVSIVQADVPKPSKTHGLDWVVLKPEPVEPPKRPRKQTPPPVYNQPLPTTFSSWKSSAGVPSFSFKKPSIPVLFGKTGGTGIGITHREYMPLTEILPIYPERALVRGVEGSCVVNYTITKTGSVKDISVDESRCSSILFHSPALKAAAKFKYAPRIVDGQPTEAQNVSKLFRFSIKE